MSTSRPVSNPSPATAAFVCTRADQIRERATRPAPRWSNLRRRTTQERLDRKVCGKRIAKYVLLVLNVFGFVDFTAFLAFFLSWFLAFFLSWFLAVLQRSEELKRRLIDPVHNPLIAISTYTETGIIQCTRVPVSAIFGCRNSVPGFLGILSSAAGVKNCDEAPTSCVLSFVQNKWRTEEKARQTILSTLVWSLALSTCTKTGALQRTPSPFLLFLCVCYESLMLIQFLLLGIMEFRTVVRPWGTKGSWCQFSDHLLYVGWNRYAPTHTFYVSAIRCL
jgi:hypothetical protein